MGKQDSRTRSSPSWSGLSELLSAPRVSCGICKPKIYYTLHQNLKFDLYHLQRRVVADPHHFDAEPAPTFPLDADAEPAPTFHNEGDPDPAAHQNCVSDPCHFVTHPDADSRIRTSNK